LYIWHQIENLTASGISEGKLMEVLVAGKRIGLVKRNTGIYAFTAACPHAGAPLCDGWLDALGRIVCPDHKYRFDPMNGRNASGEGYKLYTYPVETRGDDLFIGLLPTT